MLRGSTKGKGVYGNILGILGKYWVISGYIRIYSLLFQISNHHIDLRCPVSYPDVDNQWPWLFPWINISIVYPNIPKKGKFCKNINISQILTSTMCIKSFRNYEDKCQKEVDLALLWDVNTKYIIRTTMWINGINPATL